MFTSVYFLFCFSFSPFFRNSSYTHAGGDIGRQVGRLLVDGHHGEHRRASCTSEVNLWNLGPAQRKQRQIIYIYIYKCVENGGSG